MRDTVQKRVIRQVLSELGRPVTPAEIHEHGKKVYPKLGIATVYRIVNNLVKDNEVVPVELAGESTRYELAGKDHHHHFRCRGCAGVFELEGCPGVDHVQLPAGFIAEKHDLVFYGLCASCGA